MNQYSVIFFEIVDGKFVYLGWSVRGDHMYREVKPQYLVFGETGIALELVDGQPKLTVPAGQEAELVKHSSFHKDRKPVAGNFIEVKILQD
jgi:hypothetical protein